MFPISQTSVGEKVALEIGLPDELLAHRVREGPVCREV